MVVTETALHSRNGAEETRPSQTRFPNPTGEIIIWQAPPTRPSPTVDSILAQEPSMLTAEQERVLFATIRTGQKSFSRLLGLTRFHPSESAEENDNTPLEKEMRRLSKQTLFKNTPLWTRHRKPLQNDTQESLRSAIAQGIQAFNHLTLSYYPFARTIAAELFTPEYRRFFTFDDFISFAAEGLMHSAAVFDDNRGVKFSTFASLRMEGKIRDEIRKVFPRTVTGNRRRIEEAETAIAEAFHGQNGYSGLPQTREAKIAARTGLTTEQIRNARNPASLPPVSLDWTETSDGSDEGKPYDPADPDPNGMPETALAKKELAATVRQAVAGLSPREQKLFFMYFAEGMDQEEIAPILGVSEARVSQIYTAARAKVKTALGHDPRLQPEV